MSEVTQATGLVVARRPVVDPHGAVVGFELVFRAAARDDEPDDGPDDGPGEGPLVTLADLLGAEGTDQADLVGEAFALCEVGRAEVLGARPLGLHPASTVLDLAGQHLDDDLVEACRARRAEGFRVLLDAAPAAPPAESDPTDGPVARSAPEEGDAAAVAPDPGADDGLDDGLDLLLSVADVVRVDLGAGHDREALAALVARCHQGGAAVLAEGCADVDDLAWARESGCALLAGRAVGAPDVPTGSTIAPSVLSQVQLGVELLAADLSLDRIEMILRGEPGLVVQILAMASEGADGGARRRVRSLREALVVLGSQRLRQWAAITILGRHGEMRADALVAGLVRARMCELLAHQRGIDRSIAFTAGLLSSLDRLLGVELREVERRVAVDDALAAAAFRGESPLGVLVTNVRDYQHSVDVGFPPPARLGDLGLVAAMAFCWATSYSHQMRRAASG